MVLVYCVVVLSNVGIINVDDYNDLKYYEIQEEENCCILLEVCKLK